jgi:hypothetical protein
VLVSGLGAFGCALDNMWGESGLVTIRRS